MDSQGFMPEAPQPPQTHEKRPQLRLVIPRFTTYPLHAEESIPPQSCSGLRYSAPTSDQLREPHPAVESGPLQRGSHYRRKVCTISHSKFEPSGTPISSAKGHVTQPACSCPVLRSNFVGKPDFASIPQTSLQAPCTRCLQETDRDAPAVLSGTRELGDRSRSSNAQVDSPYERKMQQPYARKVQTNRSASIKLSCGPPAPSLDTPGDSWSSSSSPSGPSFTNTACYSTHEPRAMYSCEPRQEPGGDHPRVPLFPHECRVKVTDEEQNYPKPTVITERPSPRPYIVERNNSLIGTNEDVDYDPKQTTEKVSPARWNAGAEETDIGEEPLYDTTGGSRESSGKSSEDIHQTPRVHVGPSREAYIHRLRAQQVHRTGSLQPSGMPVVHDPLSSDRRPSSVPSFPSIAPAMAETPSNRVREYWDVPSNGPDVGSVTPFSGESHANSSAISRAHAHEEAAVATAFPSSDFWQPSQPFQGASMDSDTSHSRPLVQSETVPSVVSGIPGQNLTAISQQRGVRGTHSNYLDSYDPSVNEVNESQETCPLSPDSGALLSGAEPSFIPRTLSSSSKANGTVQTRSNNDLAVRIANIESHLYIPELTGVQQISTSSGYNINEGRQWTEGSFNAHIRSPGSTHEGPPPQACRNHIDARPPSLYELSGSQHYYVPNGKSLSNMGLEREQHVKPGLRKMPAKPSLAVLSHLPAPQSPPVVSEQPSFYPSLSTGRSPPGGTEQDAGQPGGKYPPGGMNVNIFCCSKSSTQAPQH